DRRGSRAGAAYGPGPRGERARDGGHASRAPHGGEDDGGREVGAGAGRGGGGGGAPCRGRAAAVTLRENRSRVAMRPGSAVGVVLLPGNGPRRPTELLSCLLGPFGGGAVARRR